MNAARWLAGDYLFEDTEPWHLWDEPAPVSGCLPWVLVALLAGLGFWRVIRRLPRA